MKTLNQQFPKTGIQLKTTGGLKSPDLSEIIHLDAAWETYVARGHHGDTLNLTDTTLEPTLQQLELLLIRIGGDLRRLTLSGVFNRMLNVKNYISRVFGLISTHCSLGNLEELTLSRNWGGGGDGVDIKKWGVKNSFCSGIRHLDFSRISFKESIAFAEFISMCPKLESLVLADSMFYFCGGRLVPLPLDKMMPNLKKLDLDSITFCMGRRKHRSNAPSFPCYTCYPNRMDKYEDWDDMVSFLLPGDDIYSRSVLWCCYPPSGDNPYPEKRENADRMWKKLREEKYEVYSAMMNALPNLEYLDISDIEIWDHIKQFLLRTNRKIQTVRYVCDDIHRIDQFHGRRRIILKGNDRPHASDCKEVAMYEDYPENTFWADFPANNFIRDATFEDILERIRNGQHPGIRQPVHIDHAIWHLDPPKNRWMKFFKAAQEAWRKFPFSWQVYDFYCDVMCYMLCDNTLTREEYEMEGFTCEIFEEAFREVVNYPLAKDMGLLRVMTSFYNLARDYKDGVSKRTFVEIVSALEYANNNILRESKDDMDMINFLKRKFKISAGKLVSDKNIRIPWEKRYKCQGIGLDLCKRLKK